MRYFGLLAAVAAVMVPAAPAAAHNNVAGKDVAAVAHIKAVMAAVSVYWKRTEPQTGGVPAGCSGRNGEPEWGIHVYNLVGRGAYAISPPASFSPLTDGCHVFVSEAGWVQLERFYRARDLRYAPFMFRFYGHELGHLILTRSFGISGPGHHTSLRGGGFMRPPAVYFGVCLRQWTGCHTLALMLWARGFKCPDGKCKPRRRL